LADFPGSSIYSDIGTAGIKYASFAGMMELHANWMSGPEGRCKNHK